MKIKSSIGKNVSVAVSNCREVLVQETINLLKSIGAEEGQDVLLGQMLFLYQRKGNTTETVVCDRIVYSEGRDGSSFYIVSMDGEMCRSSVFLTVDSMLAIYEAVRNVVRKE
jgi:hypothetical protein